MDLLERAIEFFKSNPEVKPDERDRAKQDVIDAVAYGRCNTITIEEANGDASLFWQAYLATQETPKENIESPV